MNYKVWDDGGESGFKVGFKNREQFTQMMMEVEMGYIKHIWCEDYTRLTRIIDDSIKIDTLIMKGEVSVYEGLMGNKLYQPNNTMERIYQVMKTMMGGDVKKDEIRKSKKQKVKLFKENGCYMKGDSPFGYKLKDKKLVINKDESKWVKKIFEWFVQGWGIDKIRTELRLRGVKRKRKNDFNWSLSNMYKILTNENYIGKDIYTDKTKDPHFEKPEFFPFEDPSLWVIHKNKCPRIVDDEVFYKSQKKMTRKKPKQTNNYYLLKGVLYCDCCGDIWTGRTRYKDMSKYYRCQNIERGYKKNNPQREHLVKKCNNPKQIEYETMNNWVWNTLIKTLNESHFIKERTKKELLGEKYGISSMRKEVNSRKKEIKKELKGLKESQYQLVEEKIFSKDLDNSQFEKLSNSVRQRISELELESSKIEKKEILMNKRTEWIDWISEHSNNVDEIMKVTDFREQRKIIDIYIEDIIIGFDKVSGQHNITINFKYPLFNDKLSYGTKKQTWDKWGEGYSIEKGENVVRLSSDNFFLGHQNFQTSPNHRRVEFGSSTPYLVFQLLSKSHLLNNSYYNNPLPKDRQIIHDEVMKLHEEGWGYTKIHKHLIKNGFKIGKSRTTVDSIIRKRLKREEFLNQKVTEDYVNFDIEFVR